MAVVSSTSCGSLNSARKSAKSWSFTDAGVLVNATVSFKASFSAEWNAALPSKHARSRNCSSVIPAFLPTAEWMSIQNGQPTSIATFNCTSSLSTGEIVRAEAHTESIQVVASNVGV
jgi:hypothetical protein